MFSPDDLLEILDYVENFDKKGIQVVLLGTHLRSGSLLCHSFLDNHPQILHLPIPFWYFFDWEYALQHDPLETLGESFLQKSLHLPTTVSNLGQARETELDLKLELVAKVAQLLLSKLSRVDRKTFLLLIHFVYAKTHGVDLSRIKVLLQHNHYLPTSFGYYSYQVLRDRMSTPAMLAPILQQSFAGMEREGDPFFQGLVRDFPNLKVLITIRSPMAGISSGLQWFQAHHDPRDLSAYWMATYCPILSYYLLYPFLLSAGERVKLVRFEEMHLRTEALMREVADYIGIEYRESLTQSTFGGHLWSGEGASQTPRFGTDPQILTREEKWKTTMNPEDQDFFLAWMNPVARLFGYETVTSRVGQGAGLTATEFSYFHHYGTYLTEGYREKVALLEEGLKPVSLSPDSGPSARTSFGSLENDLTLYRFRMQFWQQYPGMRQDILAYLQTFIPVLEQGSPVLPRLVPGEVRTS